MRLYPSHANSRNGSYILAISFLGKMETKVKAENRALGPQILEWPRGPLEEPQEKAACSPRKKYPKDCMVRIGPEPGLQPRAMNPPSHSVSILCARAGCWDFVPVFLEPKAQQQEHIGPLSIAAGGGRPRREREASHGDGTWTGVHWSVSAHSRQRGERRNSLRTCMVEQTSSVPLNGVFLQQRVGALLGRSSRP